MLPEIANANTNNIENFLKVAHSFANQKPKHLYCVIKNNELATTENKKLASSMEQFSTYILKFIDRLSIQEKEEVLQKFHIVSDAYKREHNKIFARIKRIFFSVYKQEYQRTLLLMTRIQKELEGVELEKQLEKVAQGEKLSSDRKTELFTATEKLAFSYIEEKLFEKAFKLRMKSAEVIPPGSPLKDIHDQLQKEDPKLGLQLSSIDTSIFKHQTLSVQRRKSGLHIEGKMNHPECEKLRKTLYYIKHNPQQFFATLPPGFCAGVTVTEESNDGFYGRIKKNDEEFAGEFSEDIGHDGYQLYSSKIEIHFHGIGKVNIGNDYLMTALYNRMTIDLDPNIPSEQAASKLHILFSALGFGAASSSPRKEDIERLKIMQLFRIFYPSEAYLFERNPRTYEEPIVDLKKRIAKVIPDMEKFEKDLAQMYLQEVYPGYSIWAVKGLAEQVRKAGGITLIASITGFSNAVLVSMLRLGALSTLDRLQKGMIIEGMSCAEDFKSGGAESVFASLVTSNMVKDFSSKKKDVFILYDLELLERGGYAYPSDEFGTKKGITYQKRLNILALTRQYHKKAQLSNEVCIRNRIPPQFIKGVIVPSEAKKQELVASLKVAGLVLENEAQQLCVNGIPVDRFFHVNGINPDFI